MDVYPEVIQLALLKPVSNHCRIIFDSDSERWGPTPFCFELMWLEEKEFPSLIHGWWEESKVEGWAGHRLATELKLLKDKIKKWVIRLLRM